MVKLCFDHLPTPSLKRCFAYCAIFSKDYDMKQDKVIQYWMAKGFLELTKETNMVMERMSTVILLVAKCMIWCMILHSQFQNLKL